jgi:hypothetical protein
MVLLTETDYHVVEDALGEGAKIHAATVARVYTAEGRSWTYTKIIGAVALVTSNGVQHIHVVDLKSKQIKFSQELYENFEYVEAKPFFHCFETDVNVTGLSFADTEEASEFASAVRSVSVSVSHSQPPRSAPAAPAAPAASKPKPPPIPAHESDSAPSAPPVPAPAAPMPVKKPPPPIPRHEPQEEPVPEDEPVEELSPMPAAPMRREPEPPMSAAPPPPSQSQEKASSTPPPAQQQQQQPMAESMGAKIGKFWSSMVKKS